MAARSYQASRTINAPATAVWDLLTDGPRYAHWNDAVLSLEGPIELAGTIKLVSTVDPKRTFKLKVRELRPPNHMVWSDGMPLGLFKGERTYAVSDAGDGRSDFSMVEKFSGPLAPLISKAIPDLTESFATFADSLKAAAEATQD